MPTKKDLAAQRSEAPAAPLRRGRGLRLSRATKQSKSLPRDAGAPPEPPAQAAAPIEPAVAAPEALQSAAAPPAAAIELNGQAVAPSEPEQAGPEYEKRKLKLRKDLLKELKRIARAQDLKLYQVIEAALESYIERQGEGE